MPTFLYTAAHNLSIVVVDQSPIFLSRVSEFVGAQAGLINKQVSKSLCKFDRHFRVIDAIFNGQVLIELCFLYAVCDGKEREVGPFNQRYHLVLLIYRVLVEGANWYIHLA